MRAVTRTPRLARRALVAAALAAFLFSLAPGQASAQTPPPGAAQGEAQYPESGDYLVRAGDTLYGIARTTLGDGGRYTEIFDLNEGVAQSVGGRLTDPSILRVGWVLSLPPLDPAPGGGGSDGSPDDGDNPDDSPGSGVGYTVVAGDTLYGIARDELGDGSRYNEVFEINRGRPQTVGGTLTNPGVLRVGWVLELPGEVPAPAPDGDTYTVVAGDSLSSIARVQLGSAARYPEIFDLNEGVPQAVGGALTDPSVLRVGWVLELPAT
jgi:nucleoid-associated protein YgaU